MLDLKDAYELMAFLLVSWSGFGYFITRFLIRSDPPGERTLGVTIKWVVLGGPICWFIGLLVAVLDAFEPDTRT